MPRGLDGLLARGLCEKAIQWTWGEPRRTTVAGSKRLLASWWGLEGPRLCQFLVGLFGVGYSAGVLLDAKTSPRRGEGSGGVF